MAPKEAPTLIFEKETNETTGEHTAYLLTPSEYDNYYDIVVKQVVSIEDLAQGENFLISSMLENKNAKYGYDDCNNAPECPNKVLVTDLALIGSQEYICTSCYQAYRDAERIKDLDPNQHQAAAEKVAPIVQMSVDTLKEIFLHRPNFIPYFENLRIADVKREQIEIGEGIFLSNLCEPLFQIGRWGSPHYNSCQDWKNHAWSDGFMKSIHQLEDPSVYVVWLGKATGDASMTTRALVRLVHDARNLKLKFLAVDAWYGYNAENVEKIYAALRTYAATLRRTICRVSHRQDRSVVGMIATDEPAFFTSGRTSYNDIGTWMDVAKFVDHGEDRLRGVIHVSGYSRLD